MTFLLAHVQLCAAVPPYVEHLKIKECLVPSGFAFV